MVYKSNYLSYPAAQNALSQQQSVDIHDNDGNQPLDRLEDESVFDFGDGHVTLSVEPDSGITLDETAIGSVPNGTSTGTCWMMGR